MTYQYSKLVNIEKLKTEITAANLLGLNTIWTVGLQVNIDFATEIDEPTLAALITAHTTSNPQQYINGIINGASEYGSKIIRDFGTRNILAGKTDADIDSILENLDTLKICVALISGSLKYARRKAHLIEPFTGITQDDKDWIIAQLTIYLGPE